MQNNSQERHGIWSDRKQIDRPIEYIIPQDRPRTSAVTLTDEGAVNLTIAICQQAAIDWRNAGLKLRRMEKKYQYCILCEYDGKCMWTEIRSKGLHRTRPSLKDEYRETEELYRETEEFFESDWCEELTGFDKGYLLAKLRERNPKTLKRGIKL